MDKFQAVKDAVTMQQVAEYYGYKLNRAGFINCNFHNDKTSSMKIYSGNRGYHCFGCGCGGSVIDFVCRHDNVNPLEAVKILNLVFNIGLDFNAPISEFYRITSDIRRLTRELTDAEDKASYWRLYCELEPCRKLGRIKAEERITDIEKRLDKCKLLLYSSKFDKDISEYFNTAVRDKVERWMVREMGDIL